MEDAFKADQVKPNYDKVKKIWDSLLAKYYYPDGSLNDIYLNEVNCQHCGGFEKHSLFTLNGFKHYTCEHCDVVYVTPRLKDEHLAELYSDQYYSEVYAQSMIPVFDKRKELIGQRKANQVLKYWSRKPGRLLDIGCGIGEVIDVFKDRQWECHAIEMNPTAVKWLKERNIRVFSGSFDQYPMHEKFDVIMAWGVIEHVASPENFMKKIYDHLNPQGLFASEVPNGQSLLVDYCRKTQKDPKRILMGEQHIILYSMKAYEQLHQRNGLQKLHVQTNGLDVETICKINQIKVSDPDLYVLQQCIDEYRKGDLIRGIWRKD